MVNNRVARKRSKSMVILLFPVIVLIAFMGWCMYWAGDRNRSKKIQHESPKRDPVTLIPVFLEERQEIARH